MSDYKISTKMEVSFHIECTVMQTVLTITIIVQISAVLFNAAFMIHRQISSLRLRNTCANTGIAMEHCKTTDFWAPREYVITNIRFGQP